jgi:hypothetical protein
MPGTLVYLVQLCLSTNYNGITDIKLNLST